MTFDSSIYYWLPVLQERMMRPHQNKSIMLIGNKCDYDPCITLTKSRYLTTHSSLWKQRKSHDNQINLLGQMNEGTISGETTVSSNPTQEDEEPYSYSRHIYNVTESEHIHLGESFRIPLMVIPKACLIAMLCKPIDDSSALATLIRRLRYK